MTDAAIRAEIHEALDVHRHLAPQVAFHRDLGDLRAQRRDLGLGEILHLGLGLDARARAGALRLRMADPEDVRETDDDVLVHRNVDARYTCHDLALSLFMALVAAADDVDDAAPPYHLAVLADLLHRWPYLHLDAPLPLPYPRRFAFFIRPSYWCDIRCACSWAMKSITTTTTMSRLVPPNWNGTLP